MGLFGRSERRQLDATFGEFVDLARSAPPGAVLAALRERGQGLVYRAGSAAWDRNARRLVDACVEMATRDGRMTVEDEEVVAQLATILGYDEIGFANAYPQAHAALIVARAADHRLATVEAPRLMAGPGEVVHLQTSAQLTGEPGVLCLTSGRAVFLGAQRSREVAYADLLSVDVFPEAIRLHAGGGAEALLLQLPLGMGPAAAAVVGEAARRAGGPSIAGAVSAAAAPPYWPPPGR